MTESFHNMSLGALSGKVALITGASRDASLILPHTKPCLSRKKKKP